uniref:Uncharacterized protein n=1 Tax=Opuntia streptacantha TaxID=393608 RepID=A0A7C9D5E9_OPUST
MVTAVSAMLVESIIFRHPGAGLLKTFFCSAAGTIECRDSIWNRQLSLKKELERKLSRVLFISSQPGRKTSIAPSSDSIQIFLSNCSIRTTSINSGLMLDIYFSSNCCSSIELDEAPSMCFFIISADSGSSPRLAQSNAVLPSQS